MFIFELCFTIFIYLIFPVVYVLSNGRVSREEANKIALINSIVGMVFFIILRTAISNMQTIFTTPAPAVLYYFINKWILTEKQVYIKKDDVLSDEEKNDSTLKVEEDESKTLTENEVPLLEKDEEETKEISNDEDSTSTKKEDVEIKK